MPSPGARLGSYEIRGSLGAGGMGEVFRARDLKLGRDVAIKVLPESFAADADRVARFEREARLLATVNHPHIGAIYGAIEADGVRGLVLELIEGETLAAALGRGRLPLARALTLAVQVAEALDHAHRRGIVHRDLKPSNIMITPGGAKLLDFGVGKWAVPSGSAPLAEFSTVTGDGAIVGTMTYMAPEQLHGREADARSDLFSFGAVLFEMLSGRRAFDGPSQASIIAAILEAPAPRLSEAGAVVLPRLERVVGKCLEKDPDQRWQSARDLADELKWIADETAHPASTAGATAALRAPTRRLSATTVAASAAAGLAVVVAGWALWTRAPAPSPASGSPVVRFVVQRPPNVALGGSFDLSPDGSQVVYNASGQLYVRRFDRFETFRIPGVERASLPTFSPDGQWVAFVGRGGLGKVRVSAEATPLMLAESPGTHFVSWPVQDAVFLAATNQPIRRVFAEGGSPTAVTSVRTDEVDHHSPQVLPGGDVLLFAVHGRRSRFSIAAQSLNSGQRTELVASGFDARYSPTGHLVFARGGAILAAPFDAGRLAVTGPPVTLVQQVYTDPPSGVGGFRLSATGTLVYEPRQSQEGRTLVWVDRSGNETPVPVPARAFGTPRVSPDGKQLAFVAMGDDGRSIWICEIATGKLTRLTPEGDNWAPLWTPDGSAVVYTTDAGEVTRVIRHRLDGSAPVTLGSSINDVQAGAFTADGRALVVSEAPPTEEYFISLLTPDRGGTPELLVGGPRHPVSGTLSPDGRWLAFTADGPGGRQVFIQSYPIDGTPHQVSVDGGRQPIWRRDGKELYFRSGGRMLAVSIDTTQGLRWGKPTVLFSGDYVRAFMDYDVAPDGRLLMIKPDPQEGAATHLNVIVNFAQELLTRVPVPR